jgi:hypothetical protein
LSQQIHSEPHDHFSSNNEMDLIDIILCVFKTWKPLVICLIFVSVVFGAIKAIQILVLVPEATYSKPIRLTFPGAHKMTFPSGAKFSYSDIVASTVVKEVHEKNQLQDFGFSVADLQRGLSATPYAPTYPLIIERYNKLMSDKKLTPDQIAELQKRLEKEIEQATNGEVLITLRLYKKELPEDVVTKILTDIPAAWAETALNEKGVLDINTRLASVKSLNIELIKQKESLIAADLLSEKLTLLKLNISELSSYEGIKSVIDPETGLRLTDLSLVADDLNNYTIRELIAPIQQLGLSHSPEVSRYYYTNKLNKLNASLNALEKQASAIKEVYNSYSRREPITSNNIDKGNSQMLMPELSTDMLDKLVSLSGDADREKYKQELNNKLLSIVDDIALTESTILNVQEIITGLDKFITQNETMSAKHAQYLTRMQEKLPEIIDQLSSFFSISQRIYKQLSIESVGVQDQLYIPITNTILIKKIIIDIKSTLFTWVALLFLTTVLVIPGSMIHNTMKSRYTK